MWGEEGREGGRPIRRDDMETGKEEGREGGLV